MAVESKQPIIDAVMAKSGRTCRAVSKDTNAVLIVTPALGPSLGVLPAGMCK